MKFSSKAATSLLCALLSAGMLFSASSCGKIADAADGSESYTNIYGTDNSIFNGNATEADKNSTQKATQKSTQKRETSKNRVFKANTTNQWKYYRDMGNNIIERRLVINTGWGGESVDIVQMTDMHINYCNENDLKDPVLKSTYQYRTWLKNGESLPNVERCMKSAQDADVIVLTGDVYDYYSEGVVQKADDYIFNKYKNVVGAIGNHEVVRRVQGKVEETKSEKELRDLVTRSWCNDITYESIILKDKVMAILLDNSSGKFLQEQISLFKQDLKKARTEGYVVLLFYHVPVNTGNPADAKAKALYVNDDYPANFYDCAEHPGPGSSGADKTMYDLICNNADVIKGAFCGHYHSDYYTEISAKTPNGAKTIIPQYILTGAAYDSGHMLRITIN